MTKARRWFRGVTLAMLLAGCGACFGSEAEIQVDRSGRPVLMVDGNPQSLVMGLGGFTGGDQAPAWQAFQLAGLDAVMVFANLGLYQSKLGYVSPIKYMREFWRGPDDYDDSDVEKILAAPLKANPQAKLFIWVGIGEYPEFGFMHPEDVIRNDKGEALIVESHFMRFDAAPPQPKSGHAERYAISFFSERYRQECAAMLRKFVRVVESGPYGKNVVGYLIGGGQDAQFYAWLPPDGFLQDQPNNWGDYSPVARRAFISWLSRKYEGQISALNQAWRCELSDFEQATPPPAADLAGVRPFHDLVTERRAYDWKRFLAEGRADLLDGFAAAIKGASAKKVVVGATGGDGGHRRDNTSISRMLRSPNLDFFLHQAAYATRIPPSVGGINALLDSYTANGKLFLTDMDHRLWTGKKVASKSTIGVVSFTDASVGRAADMAMQRDMWRREYARLWVSGSNGAWFNNMGQPCEYDNTEIQAEMRFLHEYSAQRLANACATVPFWQRLKKFITRVEANPAAPAEVVFVLDETAVDYARSALGEFHGAGMYRQWAEANLSGVPIRYYYAQDLREGKIPPAKVYVLQNLIDIDVVMARRIKALRQAGATIVLLQGTGIAQLARGQAEVLDDTLGIRLRQLGVATAVDNQARAVSVATTHPLLAGEAWNPATTSLGNDNLKEVAGIALRVDDPQSTTLSLYPISHMPAAAVVDSGKGKVIFVGAYTLSRNDISRLAAYAGAWRVAPPGNAIAADATLLMVHPLKDGKVEIVLKNPAALAEMQPGTRTSPRAVSHTLTLKAGQTSLFQLQP